MYCLHDDILRGVLSTTWHMYELGWSTKCQLTSCYKPNTHMWHLDRFISSFYNVSITGDSRYSPSNYKVMNYIVYGVPLRVPYIGHPYQKRVLHCSLIEGSASNIQEGLGPHCRAHWLEYPQSIDGRGKCLQLPAVRRSHK